MSSYPYRPKERRRLLLAIAVTFATMILEIVGGVWAPSLALLSDAGHMFTHLFALGTSYVAIRMAGKPADTEHSFGHYRAEILAALLNGITLIAIVGWIGWEAAQRIVAPQPIASTPMLFIATIGLIVNLSTAAILHGVSKDDLNIRGAFLHLISDTLSSVGVLGAAALIHFTQSWIADPIASVVIASMIALWSFRLLRDAFHILSEGTPRHLKVAEIVKTILREIPEINGVHHVHVWELTSRMVALTAHVQVNDLMLSRTEAIRQRLNHLLAERFRISHTTLQFEHRCIPSGEHPDHV